MLNCIANGPLSLGPWSTKQSTNSWMNFSFTADRLQFQYPCCQPHHDSMLLSLCAEVCAQWLAARDAPWGTHFCFDSGQLASLYLIWSHSVSMLVWSRARKSILITCCPICYVKDSIYMEDEAKLTEKGGWISALLYSRSRCLGTPQTSLIALEAFSLKFTGLP